AFVDGQNLYQSVREAFGYTYPNYNVSALSRSICRSKGWELRQVRFYTGIPDSSDNAFWNAFWVNKLRVLSWQQVHVYSRPLRYRHKRVTLPDGTAHTVLAGEEKGSDVRNAIDVICMTHHTEYDVPLIFSQDQDLSEVAHETHAIGQDQDCRIKDRR